MGLNCCGKATENQEANNQMLFQPKILKEIKTIKTKDEKDNEKTKTNFENSLKNQAELIADKSFEEELGENFDYLNTIDFPKDIENKKEENC